MRLRRSKPRRPRKQQRTLQQRRATLSRSALGLKGGNVHILKKRMSSVSILALSVLVQRDCAPGSVLAWAKSQQLRDGRGVGW
jgi:hypothetical protein